MGNFVSKEDYHYQTVRCNVDLLKVIQLAITLWSPEGEVPPPQALSGLLAERPAFPPEARLCPCTWQFNFQFDKDNDMYNEENVDHLAKAGLDINRCLDQGIDPNAFASLLLSSDLVCNEDTHWISFHAGYDIAYLVKLMYPKLLPKTEKEFYEQARKFFPNLWDARYMLRMGQRLAQIQQGGRDSFSPQSAPIPDISLAPQAVTLLNNLSGNKSSLQELADELGCHRVGVPHSAGSDAWLTGMIFFAMRAKIYDNRIPEDFANKIWGLNCVAPPAPASAQAAVIAQQQQQQQQQHGTTGHGGAPGTNGGGPMGFRTGGTPATHRSEVSGAPSTPTTNHPGLAGHGGTPGPQGHGAGGYNTMTPGGGAGGVFGNFQYGK